MSRYAEVALDVAVFGALTYRIPETLDDRIRAGHLVQVPFRNKSKRGVVLRVVDQAPDDLDPEKVRDVVDLVESEPLLSGEMMSFLRFLGDYYMSPIGEVMRLAIPSAVRIEGKKQYVRREDAAAEDVPPHLRLIFETLPVGEPLPVEAIRESSGLLYEELAELESAGVVDAVYDEEERLSVKTDKFYALIDEDPSRLGSKQAEIVEFLRDAAEPVALSELREVFDAVHSSLNGLEDRGIVSVDEREVYRDPFASDEVAERNDAPLTPEQREAFGAIDGSITAGEFRATLLHGVTGSGKTRVYAEAIRRVIEEGRTAIVLLPEIALTPQFVSVFRAYFPDAIAVLHSGLSQAEKFDEWRRIRRGEVDIVIGARSALFAPLRNVGIIVVDEEHDTSFKQEEGTRYNARDMAIVRGKLENAVVVLGSATPSLESYENAREGRYLYLRMPNRVHQRPMPAVELVDMRRKPDADERRSDVMSEALLEALDLTRKNEQQAILFLNRRGFSPCVLCEVCGHIWRCPNCDVSLTYHRRQEALRCHHCDHSLRLPETCPECSNPGVGPRGVGTEQLEAHLGGLLPETRIGRLDRDTAVGRRLQALLRRFRRRELDVLIGTQMVTKGHDFPGVTTVGVVLADLGLNFPDFRGAERTFQLLMQVAGRAGRGDEPGRVFVQTYVPEHFALRAASEHDYEYFAEEELMRRSLLGDPPFGHMITVKFEASRESNVSATARKYLVAARKRLRQEDAGWGDVKVKGPAPAPFERLRGRTRWQMLFQSTDRSALRRLVQNVLHDVGHFEPDRKGRGGTHVIVDVDPVNML